MKDYEALVVLGRSVGKNKKGEWRPSPYFGNMLNDRPVPHSGVYNNKIDPHEDGVIVAGGNACVLAAAHLLKENPGIQTVIFAAGRPPYIVQASDNPDFSEGSVLEQQLLHKLALYNLPRPDTVVLGQDQNTMDDMVNSMAVVKARGLQSIAYLTVRVHVKRSQAFLDEKVPASDKAGLNIDFLAAEDILEVVDPRYEKMFKKARATPAYRRTSFYEGRGTRALKAGNY